MHEVKVYDNAGNLKKVISIGTLNARSKKQLEEPHLFKRNKRRPGRPAAKPKEI